MKVWGLWYGGSSYVCPPIEGVEEFDSIRQAKDVFWSRDEGWDPRAGVRTPCVDERSEMQLFFHDPRGDHDPYPDRRLFMGPRGGVREEPC